jgi:hypothetical protein
MGRLVITETELAEVETLKENGTLKEIRHSKISPDCVVMACGDGHEYLDIFDHHRTLCRANGEEMIHQHLANGGPLMLEESSPLNEDLPGDEWMIRQIRRSLYDIKHTRNLLLRLHTPCRGARIVGAGPTLQVGILRNVVRRLDSRLDGVKINRLFDVRYADGRLRSYFINL